MKKAMLSQPMAGKTDEEIIATRERAKAFLEGEDHTCDETRYMCMARPIWKSKLKGGWNIV